MNIVLGKYYIFLSFLVLVLFLLFYILEYMEIIINVFSWKLEFKMY